MTINERTAPLCTIFIHTGPAASDHPYSLLVGGVGLFAEMRTLENAITRLRDRGEDRAMVVKGKESYILAWGPLTVPLEHVLW